MPSASCKYYDENEGGDQKAIAHIIDNMSIRMTEHAHTTKHMVDVFLQQPVVLI